MIDCARAGVTDNAAADARPAASSVAVIADVRAIAVIELPP
jgi:hypothetical protein